MEAEYWRVLQQIVRMGGAGQEGTKLEEIKIDGMRVLGESTSSPKIRLEENDLEELYRVENGPLIPWEDGFETGAPLTGSEL
ncbi:hypothetical protein TWF192_004294 [Orbilia oligospora]|uniref:Uncharacterized protein n=1 Tax=Orbilia oligospora TaxID=2813651 RepID=A0A6G1MCY2_ORBOL|nr:hypothetical protein TWF191_002730 [Orbilia oligospora]KAF3253009.1 hypothetical protein TWF192_004294 [Orbilia oligospora]